MTETAKTSRVGTPALMLLIVAVGFVLAFILRDADRESARAELLVETKGRPDAPDFTLPRLEGGELSLDDLKGKPAVLNFWATWCEPCKAEMPSLQRASQALEKDGIPVLGIHVGGNAGEVKAFVERYGLSFPMLHDKEQRVMGVWPVQGFPTTFVVDSEGFIAYHAIGPREWDRPEILDTIRGVQ